jgi:hypothetical protein
MNIQSNVSIRYLSKCMCMGNLSKCVCKLEIFYTDLENRIGGDVIEVPPERNNEKGVSADNIRLLGEKDNKALGSIFKIGDIVEAKFGGLDVWFKGKITNINRDNTYDIRYDDRDCKVAPKTFKVPLSFLQVAGGEFYLRLFGSTEKYLIDLTKAPGTHPSHLNSKVKLGSREFIVSPSWSSPANTYCARNLQEDMSKLSF